MLRNFLESAKLSRHLNNSRVNLDVKHFTTKSQPGTCSRAVNEAEKIVGYPTSFLSLRWLLNDEMSNIAMHIKKLIGTNHPLLATARDLIMSKQTPTWGLIVLLISKAGGLKKEFSTMDCDITAGILHSQRVLAEITEMIRTSNKLHRSILNQTSENAEQVADMHFGNKLSLLTGDYLLSSSFKELAGLKNQEVNEIISTSLRDIVEAEFIDPRDQQNMPLPAQPLGKKPTEVTIPNEFGTAPMKIKDALGNAKSEWILRHFLGSASLLAKSCQGALKLAHHSQELQELGYLFGRNLGLTWHAHLDMEIFVKINNEPFSLICAPLMFHLEHDPSFYNEVKNIDDVRKANFESIKKAVALGPGLEKTELMKKEFSENAIRALAKFPDGDAKRALQNIVTAL